MKILERISGAWRAFKDPQALNLKDSLTGVLSRRNFEFSAQKEIARAERTQQYLSLAFIDLNGLKKVNDNYGHQAGDNYLQEFCRKALAFIRPYDLLGRFGGDEFVILFPGTEKSNAENIISRVYKSFPNFAWGISSFGPDDTLEKLIKRADERMYRRKKEMKKNNITG